MITEKRPKSWQELQEMVGEILAECGFNVQIEKEVTTARGIVEVDVYAEETVKGRTYSILCECKYWKRKIPQTIAHSIRSVVADLGVNKGYIISKNGFQSGTYNASCFTNVSLLTWEDFLTEFYESWLENCFIPSMTEKLDTFMRYTEPLVCQWMCSIPDEEVEVVKALREKYIPFSCLVAHCSKYLNIFSQKSIPSLPLLNNPDFKNEFLQSVPEEVRCATGYKEFLKACLEYGEMAVAEFNAVRRRNRV